MSRSSFTRSGNSHHVGHEIRNYALNVNEFIGLLNALDMAMVSLRMMVVIQNGRDLLARQYKRQTVTNTLRLNHTKNSAANATASGNAAAVSCSCWRALFEGEHRDRGENPGFPASKRAGLPVGSLRVLVALCLQLRLVPAIVSGRVFLITDDLWLRGAELNLRKRRRVALRRLNNQVAVLNSGIEASA